MRLSRAIAVSVLIGTLALPVEAPAAPARRSSIPVVSGTTAVVGSESGYALVRLTRTIDPVKLRPEVEGNGRVIGVVMARQERGRVTPDASVMDITSFGHCGTEPGCAPQPGYRSIGWGATTRTLRPGVYRLYLIADGTPARVTLEFPELDGRVTISPNRVGKTVIESIEPKLHVAPYGSFYTAGAKAPFKGPGIAAFAQTIHSPGTGTAVWGSCFYEDEVPADDTLAYMPPACPQGPPQREPWIKEYDEDGEEGLGFVLSASYIPAAMGGWYTTTSEVDVTGSVALWLEF